jgi:hypothetical protein
VEYGSRSLDPIGRIWWVVCLIFLATWLWWWQELHCARRKKLGISGNKAVFPIFWRRSPVMPSARLPRWKRIGGSLCCWSSLVLLSLLASGGGE